MFRWVRPIRPSPRLGPDLTTTGSRFAGSEFRAGSRSALEPLNLGTLPELDPANRTRS